uniref:Uncharacterized protein n=1 Tax=Chromera velia CCMP2878 TaxID=1169474 RepID=A0A0G4GSI0_9ALVE|eukprot:Cvel_23185.t1-p1 / transcript=Cvel_23185.t1 / gene=Cvel_23185 / organism=Chromera_velia_CCMP2878 / gene_product=hypothetical protein / transcript_product=hypothetical protein / location=Cvel_scaffold2361:13765-27453(-) / protein_length=204 / sequence_SO=supercontig / SO=protein_coding / is_pseudo=false
MGSGRGGDSGHGRQPQNPPPSNQAQGDGDERIDGQGGAAAGAAGVVCSDSIAALHLEASVRGLKERFDKERIAEEDRVETVTVVCGYCGSVELPEGTRLSTASLEVWQKYFPYVKFLLDIIHLMWRTVREGCKAGHVAITIFYKELSTAFFMRHEGDWWSIIDTYKRVRKLSEAEAIALARTLMAKLRPLSTVGYPPQTPSLSD